MSNGFLRISRALFDHPFMQKAPPSYWKILFVLMNHSCFKEMVIDDHGKKIKLFAGQVCCTIRQLADWCDLPQTTVNRALSKFLKEKITEQKVEHTKSVFTISTTYLLQDSGTTFGTRTEQERNTKEEVEEGEEEYEYPSSLKSTDVPTTAKGQEDSSSSFFYDCLKELDIEEIYKVDLTKEFPEIKVAAAVEYVQDERFVMKKSIEHTLFWFCRSKKRILHPEKPRAVWETLASKHNEIYAHHFPKGFVKNQELIKQQKMMIWQINSFVPISLGISIEELKKDFERAEKEFKIAAKNHQNRNKIEKLEQFA